jgi:hypothetical protein
VSSQDRRQVVLDVSSIGSGKVIVGGVDMANDVIGVGVEVIPGRSTEVKLRMRGGLLAALADAEVRVDSATSAALIELGWTPPGGHTPKLKPARILPVSLSETGEFVLTWHPVDDGDPVEIPLGEGWVLPGTDVSVGEFRLSTREVPAADEPMLCDGCDRTDKPVEATDDGRALICPDCKAALAREVPDGEVSGG